ncbi:hypothetical protein T484DRAFT_1975843 [Baffinella frigidus]|nr:hypothetical protein T484DRAFT_1975843 [Cryptophyta sp. CCMP2293]
MGGWLGAGATGGSCTLSVTAARATWSRWRKRWIASRDTTSPTSSCNITSHPASPPPVSWRSCSVIY